MPYCSVTESGRSCVTVLTEVASKEAVAPFPSMVPLSNSPRRPSAAVLPLTYSVPPLSSFGNRSYPFGGATRMLFNQA